MSTSAQILTAQQTIATILPGQIFIWPPGLRGADGQLIAPTEVCVSNGCDWEISGTSVAIVNNTGLTQSNVFLKATRQHSDELQAFPANAGTPVAFPSLSVPAGAKAIFVADSGAAPLAATTLPSEEGVVDQIGVTVAAGVVTIPNTNVFLAGIYQVDGAVSISNLNAAARSCRIQVRDTTSAVIYWSGLTTLAIGATQAIPFHAFIEKAVSQAITLVVEIVPVGPAVIGDFQLLGEASEVALAWTLQKIA